MQGADGRAQGCCYSIPLLSSYQGETWDHLNPSPALGRVRTGTHQPPPSTSITQHQPQNYQHPRPAAAGCTGQQPNGAPKVGTPVPGLLAWNQAGTDAGLCNVCPRDTLCRAPTPLQQPQLPKQLMNHRLPPAGTTLNPCCPWHGAPGATSPYCTSRMGEPTAGPPWASLDTERRVWGATVPHSCSLHPLGAREQGGDPDRAQGEGEPVPACNEKVLKDKPFPLPPSAPWGSWLQLG